MPAVKCPLCQTSFNFPAAFSGKPITCVNADCGNVFKAIASGSGVSPPLKESARKSSPSLPRSGAMPAAGSGKTSRPNLKSQKPETTPATSRSRQNSAPKGKGLILGIVAVAISVVAALGVGGYFLAGKLREKPAAAKPATTPTAVARVEIPTKGPELNQRQVRQELKPGEIIDLLTQSTVMILNIAAEGGGSRGSGVLVHRDPNVILTNDHVIRGAKTIAVFFPEKNASGQFETNENHYSKNAKKLYLAGKVIAQDQGRDLALVEIPSAPPASLPIPLAAKSAGKIEPVFGVGQSNSTFNSLWQPHSGQTRQTADVECYENLPGTFKALLTQSPVNPGDSGGPVVNQFLDLVGIVSAKAKRQDNLTINIDISEIRPYLESNFKSTYKKAFVNPPSLSGLGAETKPKSKEELLADIETGSTAEAQRAGFQLIRHGAEVVPLLTALLEKPSAAGRWPIVLGVLEQLGDVAAAAVEPAIECMRAKHTPTKIAAVKFLRAVAPHGRKGVAGMWEFLSSDEPTLRREAEITILRYGPYGRNDVRALREEAARPNFAVRELVVHLLCEMNDLSNTELSRELQELVKPTDPDHRVRVLLAEISRQYPKRFTRKELFTRLLPLLGDANKPVEAEARRALEELTWNRKKVTPLTDSANRPILDASGEAIQLTGYAPATIGDLLADDELPSFDLFPEKPKHTDAQNHAIKLKKCRQVSDADVSELLELASGGSISPPGIVYAMGLVQSLGEKAIVKATEWQQFLDPEKYPDPRIPRAALRVLTVQKTAVDELQPLLLGLYRHPDKEVQKECLITLGKCKNKHDGNWKIFFEAMNDGDERVRELGMLALRSNLESNSAAYRAASDIAGYMESYGVSGQAIARSEAIRLLATSGEIARPSIEVLKKALEDADLSTQLWAIRGLSQFNEGAQLIVDKFQDSLSDDLRFDTVQFVSDAASIHQFQPSDYAMTPGVPPHEEIRAFHNMVKAKLAKRENLREDEADRAIRNALLRRAVLAAMNRLGPAHPKVLPSLDSMLQKTTNIEVLLLTLSVIKSYGPTAVAEVPKVVDHCVYIYSLGLDKEALAGGLGEAEKIAMEKRLAIFMKSLVDTVREMGVAALPHLDAGLRATFAAQKMRTDRLLCLARWECMAAILGKPEIKVEKKVISSLLGVLQTSDKSILAQIDLFDKQVVRRQEGESMESYRERTSGKGEYLQFFRDAHLIVRDCQNKTRELDKKSSK